MQLSLVKNQLLDEVNCSSLQPELYQHLLLILLTICRSHPDNLSLVAAPLAQIFRTCLREEETGVGGVSDPVADGCGLWAETVDKLNEVFWSLYKKRPSNLNIAPVCNTGKTGLINIHVHVTCTCIY